MNICNIKLMYEPHSDVTIGLINYHFSGSLVWAHFFITNFLIEISYLLRGAPGYIAPVLEVRLNDELVKIFKDKVIGFPTLMEVIE